MQISAHSQAYTRSTSRSKSPDEVSPEFPERHTEPGPDDVYDPDFNRRGNGSGSQGPHYNDNDTSGGGSSWVLF